MLRDERGLRFERRSLRLFIGGLGFDTQLVADLLGHIGLVRERLRGVLVLQRRGVNALGLLGDLAREAEAREQVVGLARVREE